MGCLRLNYTDEIHFCSNATDMSVGSWSLVRLGEFFLSYRGPSRPYINVIKGRCNDAGPQQHDFCLIATLLH